MGSVSLYFKPDMKTVNPQKRLYLAAAFILLFGFAGAGSIYLTAVSGPEGISGYGADGGYSIMPEDSKMYRHDLELYGGKVNVFADDLRRWFVGLWHGKPLAFIIGCSSVLLSLGFFSAARRLRPEPGSGGSEAGTEPPEKS